LAYPVVAAIHQLDEHLRRGQPLAIVLLECAEAGLVDIQTGHVSDGEWAEEWKPVAERGTHHDVDVLRGCDALLDEVDGLLQQDVLQPVQHEPGLVVDPGGELAGKRNHGLGSLHNGLGGACMCDQLDPGDEGCWVGKVNAQEALRVSQICRQVSDREGGGVAADDRVRASGRLDGLQHRALDLRLLQHSFLNQIRLGDRFSQVVRCAQVGPDQVSRSGIEEPLGLEVIGFAIQPVEVATGQSGIGVDDHYGEPCHRKDLGDTATHVAGPDDSDVFDLLSHAGHDLPWCDPRCYRIYGT